MSVKNIVEKQYRDKVDAVVTMLGDFHERPSEGWIRTVRRALGMSGTQLAKRLGVSKARVSKLEKDEATGSVTLKTMQNTAKAMNCRFVYAVVPHDHVEEVILLQAHKKAGKRLKNTSIHMALEGQSLTSTEQIEFEHERITSELLKQMPTDFWDEEE